MKDKLEQMKNFKYQNPEELRVFEFGDEEYTECLKTKKESEDKLEEEQKHLSEWESLTLRTSVSTITSWEFKEMAVKLDSKFKFKVNSNMLEINELRESCNDARKKSMSVIQSYLKIIEACDENLKLMDEWNRFLDHWIKEEVGNLVL
tara:strand:+ start:646 stop:1089 length:444 start_codon:yes stop_codon:yes gene_type:complete